MRGWAGGRIVAVFAWALLLPAAIPAKAWALQAPPTDTIRASLPTSEIRALFGERFVELSSDRIEPAIPEEEVEEIFRIRLEVAVSSNGGILDSNGFGVVVTGPGAGLDTLVQRVSGNDTVVAFGLTMPGAYQVSVDGLDAPCIVPPTTVVDLDRGMTAPARIELDCLQPTSLTVVSDPRGSPFGSPWIRLGAQERELGTGVPVTFADLRPGPNELRLSIPERLPEPSGLELDFPEDTPDAVSVTLVGGETRLVVPGRPVSFPRAGAEPIHLTLEVPSSAPADPSPTALAVAVEGEGAVKLEPGMARIRIDGRDPQPIGPGVTAHFENVTTDSVHLVLELDPDFGPVRDGWHLSAGLGVMAVAATDPTSFITPTAGVSLVKDRPDQAEWFQLNAQVGYWRAGPSSSDPVLPEDPRPPFRNRTIWTWSLGASLFPEGWGGLGFSASWVEGRETASEQEQYINRTRGVAVGPRFRLAYAEPWPSIVLGLDAQYGEADQLLLDEPELGWSLTPVVSLSYVFR